MVDNFFTTIDGDGELKKTFPGLQVRKNINRRVLANTMKGGPGNCMVAISKQRAAKFQWNAGGLAGQQAQTVRIDIIARTLEASVVASTGPNPPTTARDIVEAIKRRIEDLLFTATYNGTGWLMHTEADDGYPSAPLEKMAFNRVIYDCWTTMG
jgi:hypothetical protein